MEGRGCWYWAPGNGQEVPAPCRARQETPAETALHGQESGSQEWGRWDATVWLPPSLTAPYANALWGF